MIGLLTATGLIIDALTVSFATLNSNMSDESSLPYEQQSLVYRLRKRAEIRRQISTRKSVQEGRPDRLADLLEEAANHIERLESEEPMPGAC